MALTEEQLHNSRIKAKKVFYSFWGFFVKNLIVTYVFAGLILILGIFAVFQIDKEANPEVRFPIAIITAVYPGTSPVDMENLVTNKIEADLQKVNDITYIASTSSEGVAIFRIEYDTNANIDQSISDLKERMRTLENELPDDVSTFVQEIDISDMPIFNLTLSGPYEENTLKRYADILEDELSRVRGVREVLVLGGQKREFQILIDKDKILTYGINYMQLIQILRANNVNIPIGNIEGEGYNFAVTLDSQFQDTQSLENLIITNKNGVPIYLRDIAIVLDGLAERTALTYFVNENNEKNISIALQIKKSPDSTIFDIGTNVKEKIKEVQTTFPEDLNIEIVLDLSEYVIDSFLVFRDNGIQTLIIVFIILLLFLGFKESFLVSLGIPFAYILGILFVYYTGDSLNSINLFAMVLTLGMLVDSMIVITDGIHDYITQGYNKRTSILLAINEFKIPMIAGAFTTIAAFFPLLLLSGIMGSFIKTIPRMVISVLLASLIVALVFIPPFALKFLNNIKSVGIKINFLYKPYKLLLSQILYHTFIRRLMIFGLWILFFISIALVPLGFLKIEMFPQIDIDFFYINIDMPTGSQLNQTEFVIDTIQKELVQNDNIKNLTINIGKSQRGDLSSFMSSVSRGIDTSIASIVVNLKDENKRDQKSYEIVQNIRPLLEELSKYNDANISITEESAGPPTGSPIQIKVFGDDYRDIIATSNSIKLIMQDIEGIVDLDDNYNEGQGRFQIDLDREKLNMYGLSVMDIATTYRLALYGMNIFTNRIDGEDIDFFMQVRDFEKGEIINPFSTIDDVQNFEIPLNPNLSIRLSDIANIDFVPTIQNINHEEGQRVISITANTDGRNANDIFNEIEEKLVDIVIPSGIDVVMGGEREEIESSFADLGYIMILAIFLIGMILVLQFSSIKQPFIVIFTIPLALIGVMWGLFFINFAFSFTAFIGLIGLAGVAVNNAIILISIFNNKFRCESKEEGQYGLCYINMTKEKFIDEIINASQSRLRPIILTSLTTIFGIAPLIWQDEMFGGLAAAFVFGLVASTFLTLFVVPAMYYGFERKKIIK